MAFQVHSRNCPHPPDFAPTAVGQHFTDTANGVAYVSIGTSSVADWVPINTNDFILTGTVTASTSDDVDILALADFCAAKYFICIFNSTEDKFKSFELLGSKNTSTSVDYTSSSITGAQIAATTTFDVSGTDAKLTINNLESFDLDYRIRRVTV